MTLRPPLTPITAELYRQLPEGPPYYQLIEGNLIMSPSPNFYHQKILGRLHLQIGNFLEDNPVGQLILAPSDVFINGINVYQPDLYFVSNERRDVSVTGEVEGAPDLVVEILSPSTEERDRNEKRGVYARAGVKEMWIVDPEARQIELHSLSEGLNFPPKIVREPDLFSSSLFPGLQIDTVRLFKTVP